MGGNIFNGGQVRKDDSLRFETRDVVHIILDYADSFYWKLYAKVGDIDESDYDDLAHAAANGHICSIFDAINPGSYRLAVSLFSQMDALIIESCKIHGSEQANFYQELKSYSKGNSNAEESEMKQTETEQIETPKMVQPIDEEKVIETVDNGMSSRPPMQMQTENIVSPELTYNKQPNEEEEDEEEVPIPINQKMQSVIVHDDDFEDPRQKILDEKNANANTKQKNNNEEIEQQQLETIQSLKTQIAELQKQNETKDGLIEDARRKEKESKDELDKMEKQMREYQNKCNLAEAELEAMNEEMEAKEKTDKEQKNEMNALSRENERLAHELKLAQDCAQSLEDKKVEMQERLNNAIESKMKLVVSTSEEIDHYRKLIQQIAQNKLGCKILSEFIKPQNGKNGYY